MYISSVSQATLATILTVAVSTSIPQGLFWEKAPDLTEASAVFADFTEGLQYNAGISEIALTRRERADASSPWTKSLNTYSTRLKIVAVASRLGGREVFVAGVEPTTEVSIIERWTFPVRRGRWHHNYTGTANPIGTPTAAYTGVNAIQGAQFENPPAAWWSPTREVIFRSSAYGFVRAVEVDPEGRYVLFTTYPGAAVHQLDLANIAAGPSLLFGTSQIPELTQANWIVMRQHADLGRVCVLTPPNTMEASNQNPQLACVYLVDGNNDGVFEAHSLVPLDDHLQSLVDLITDPVTFDVVPVPDFKWSAPWKQ